MEKPSLYFVFGDGDNIYQVIMVDEVGREAIDKAVYNVAKAIHDKEGNRIPEHLSESEIEALRGELRATIDFHRMDLDYDWIPFEWVFEDGMLPKMNTENQVRQFITGDLNE